ncbi:YciI family protein [uncultured Propionibacterium sp.]|uniref:YciI family protein n=1 Tax=uncultured Propionibacterium sp. TaxID=218066 RepID=UPI00292D5D11|nr:YciI family protein [uncultured Propionibacterium sp.]
MSFFIINYTYDPAKDADAVRPAHRAYLRELFAAGSLKAAGPLLGTDPVRALLIVETPDEAAAAALSDADPMLTEGIVLERSIIEWNPVTGVFAQA